ncbi:MULTISPECIES: GntR family transcriptional regulator [Actinopolyspora]|uniref:DNA-binding transcriptional regulator, GntR family n=1 Tax=Actinopolyspora saharensis TaxID=995062 RepID=A0A1H0Y8C6_9ACTN|nr:MULTISPECIES: GntR family transcriptional regulator [Actinopolyspora]NHD17596.1 GntR family transcriptional regulator [Actinopolyspora sp. BKK2]NHE76671.1 GntR family transcriptional regulator [Actinopolyspora sp. BKK1]SDQ11407.1 DNA-binding transcriptional regulator, GntR family [Actinopolyspora saharensis]
MRSRSNSTRTSRDLATAEVRRRILDLTLEPGSGIAENELAAELSVSRTPVREALILLANDGLVEIYPQVGTFVSRIDPTAVADAQFIREALELASFRELTRSIEQPQLRKLRENLEQQQLAVNARDVDRFFELDETLHATMLRMADHEAAWDVVSSAKAHLDRARRACLPIADTLERMLEQHAEIVDRLESGPPETAEEALRSHLREVFHDIDAVKARTPEYFTSGPTRPVRKAYLA